MRKKYLLLGMITLLAVSLCGCTKNTQNATTVETSAGESEVSATEKETMTTGEQATTSEEQATIVNEESTPNEDEANMFYLPESQEYYEDIYQTVLDDTYKMLTDGMDDYDDRDGISGIREASMNDEENAKDTIGYAFVDSNADGQAELIIGSINEQKDDKYYGDMIYAAYTYQEKPVLILEGWSRNRCHLLNDGVYYVEGSGGAMYAVFENKQLEKNGTDFIYNDYCFTCEKDDTFEEVCYYRNTTGQWDKAVSEEISQEEYTNRFDEYSAKIETLQLKPFSMYESSKDATNTKDEEVNMQIEWATDNQLSDGTVPVFEVNASEPLVAVTVSPDTDVHNFRVLSLSFDDVDSADNPVFSVTELYQQELLAGGTQFVIRIAMIGTIPGYGISYEDASGKTHYYALTESGMDGSALLTEIVVK